MGHKKRREKPNLDTSKLTELFNNTDLNKLVDGLKANMKGSDEGESISEMINTGNFSELLSSFMNNTGRERELFFDRGSNETDPFLNLIYAMKPFMDNRNSNAFEDIIKIFVIQKVLSKGKTKN